MSCQAIELSDGRAVMQCRTSGIFFGPAFDEPAAADEYIFWLRRTHNLDPRQLDEQLTKEWDEWSPSDDERAMLGKIDGLMDEEDTAGLLLTNIAPTEAQRDQIKRLAKCGLVEVAHGLVSLTDAGIDFVREFC